MNCPRQIAKRIIADSSFSRSQGQKAKYSRRANVVRCCPITDVQRLLRHVRSVPKPVIREVQQDEGPRLRTARSKFLAGGVMVGFLGFD
jgi:hypothetical protein